MDGSHFSKCQIVQPIALGEVSSLILLHQLPEAINISKVARACSQTFSRRPISSRVPSLLGVVESSDPSASRPAHRNKRCLPLRSVLSQTKCQKHFRFRKDASAWHHFFPKSLKVEPPTGTADLGPAISQTVNVICELSGRSQYRIGKVIHSFHLSAADY